MEISALSASTSKSSTALSQLTGNLDSFLTLLTTQLKNQDPLDPLDTEKFTSQLVEFASVEQSIQTNKHLEALISLQAAADREGALVMLGKTVVVEGGKAANAGAGAAWSYELPNAAASVKLVVLDAAGLPIGQFDGDPRAGAHDFAWNGKRADGGDAPAGLYTLAVTAKDASGATISTTVQSRTTVNAVAFAASGSLLETPLGSLPLSAVKRVIGG
jgi:flagellar basal-body rod modification protein FlgD